jgi:hypothetical protein
MRKLTVVAAIALAVGAAQADPVFDPGALGGVDQFHHVRAVVSPDAAIMAWLSAPAFQKGQIFVATATDDGGWSSPVQVSGSYPEWVLSDGGADEFALARAFDGTYRLAWSALTGWRAAVTAGHGSADAGLDYVLSSPDIWVAASSDGRTWSAPQPVALAPTSDRAPGIIDMPGGDTGIIWVSDRDGRPALSLAFAAPGQPWSEAVSVAPGIAGGNQYDLAHVGSLFVPDRRGRLSLAWVSDATLRSGEAPALRSTSDGGEPEVWTAFSADGRAWSPAVKVSSGPGDKGFVTIEEAAEGYNLYWSVQAGQDEQRWVSHSTDFATWSEPQLAPVGK